MPKLFLLLPNPLLFRFTSLLGKPQFFLMLPLDPTGGQLLRAAAFLIGTLPRLLLRSSLRGFRLQPAILLGLPLRCLCLYARLFLAAALFFRLHASPFFTADCGLPFFFCSPA
jgi:hypothetical protein